MTLRLLVNEKGRVEQVDIHQTSGVPRLDESARQWAQRVVFKPAMKNGRPVPMSALLDYTFNLNN